MMKQFKEVDAIDVQLAKNGFVTQRLKDWLEIDTEWETIGPENLPWLMVLSKYYELGI